MRESAPHPPPRGRVKADRLDCVVDAIVLHDLAAVIDADDLDESHPVLATYRPNPDAVFCGDRLELFGRYVPTGSRLALDKMVVSVVEIGRTVVRDRLLDILAQRLDRFVAAEGFVALDGQRRNTDVRHRVIAEADNVDLSRRFAPRDALRRQRPTKRAVKGLSLDGTLRPLPWKSAGGAKSRGAQTHARGATARPRH
jgi:hypothetical protein